MINGSGFLYLEPVERLTCDSKDAILLRNKAGYKGSCLSLEFADRASRVWCMAAIQRLLCGPAPSVDNSEFITL
jgi:hypothetical protein